MTAAPNAAGLPPATGAPRPRYSFWFHALAVLALAGVLAVRFAPAVLQPTGLVDEDGYVEAAVAVDQGVSPYTVRSYLYPPALAFAGAWVLHHLGLPAMLVAMRLANLLGVATAIWWALAYLPFSPRRRWVVAALYLLVAPAVVQGVRFGNLSLAVSGMVVAGLLIWPRWPLLAGLLLGGSVLVKPLAPVALGALLVHRPTAGGHRHRVAAGAGLAIAAAGLLAVPGLGRMLVLGSAPELAHRSVSFHRIGLLLGLHVSPLWITLAIAMVVALAVRWRSLSPEQLTGLAVAGCLAATPLVWNHTLLVALPLETLAIALVLRRRRAGLSGWSGRYEPVLVGLAVAALQLAEGATGIDDRGRWLQLFAVLPPALAPGSLAAYLIFAGASRRRAAAASSLGATAS